MCGRHTVIVQRSVRPCVRHTVVEAGVLSCLRMFSVHTDGAAIADAADLAETPAQHNPRVVCRCVPCWSAPLVGVVTYDMHGEEVSTCSPTVGAHVRPWEMINNQRPPRRGATYEKASLRGNGGSIVDEGVPSYSNQPPTMLSYLCDCPTIGADCPTVGHRLWSDLSVATSYLRNCGANRS